MIVVIKHTGTGVACLVRATLRPATIHHVPNVLGHVHHAVHVRHAPGLVRVTDAAGPIREIAVNKSLSARQIVRVKTDENTRAFRELYIRNKYIYRHIQTRQDRTNKY